jgi:hypothetical protein
MMSVVGMDAIGSAMSQPLNRIYRRRESAGCREQVPEHVQIGAARIEAVIRR